MVAQFEGFTLLKKHVDVVSRALFCHLLFGTLSEFLSKKIVILQKHCQVFYHILLGGRSPNYAYIAHTVRLNMNDTEGMISAYFYRVEHFVQGY